MAEAFLSPSWYRVATLRARVKPQARIRRHRFRGEAWYVVQNPASGQFHRFTPATYQLIGWMDGIRTIDEVWNAAAESLGDDAPGQEEVIHLLSQLHAGDLLQCEASPDTLELFERFAKQARARRTANWRNPFSIRIPLWDPDRFLTRTLPLARPFLGWGGVLVYLVVVGAALVLAGVNWRELTGNLSDRVLSGSNLLLLWLVFPLVKLAHELGHGYATKAEGGEVHEMGILLLVFMPVPDVDATAASGFRSKWRRVLVGAAGMIVESFIAALCVFMWAAAEPGVVRAVAFNVILIAGLSTLVFNGNPLLRYDGYYMFSDAIEIPNLAQRGTQYWRYLAERYLFRVQGAEPPLLGPGERAWLLAYTPAAFLYRTAVMIAIMLFIAGEWFLIGVLLAIWGGVTMFVWPVAKTIWYLASSPRLQRDRRRAVIVTAAATAVVLAVVLFVPWPLRIQAEGVVWLPEEAQVRAGGDGFVRAVLERPGAAVAADTPLIESFDPVLATQIRVAAARVAEVEARLDSQLFVDRVQAELARQELDRERAGLDRLEERADQLIVRSRTAGRFVLAEAEDLPGRFFKKGQLIGYLTQDARRLVRVVVSQDDVDLVRTGLERAEVRFAERPADIYRVTVVREVPAARDQVPSAALSSEGGGQVPADPREPGSGKALLSTFQFDLELPPEAPAVSFGGRVHVRFVHAMEPLGRQWHRRVRQAFLARFNV